MNVYNSGLGQKAGSALRFCAGFTPEADVAQLVEQLIRNEKVEGSTPFIGTRKIKQLRQPAEVGVIAFGLSKHFINTVDKCLLIPSPNG
jgi:hypothetical protein